MTREEAIKEIKSWDFLEGKEIEAIQTLIPELAESEDERIRKEIIEYLKLVDKGEGDYAHPMVSGWIAWLEKQKENPKSSDSIPSDCTSDAKCEDRWHKVTDSLPDNGRLVLAKDCLGNVLLARYDGENWEVNVYDNEDHYCHNSISKWCEIPSEKQKEQKPWKVGANAYFTPEQKPVDLSEMMVHKEPYIAPVPTPMVADEQKPAEWSEEDENVYESIQTILLSEARFVEERKWFDLIKARIKSACWDEKDEKMRDRLIDRLQFITLNTRTDTTSPNITFFDEIAWLKSLRPSWKPSEEQMKALLNAKGFLLAGLQHDSAKTIIKLYKQLKKL